MTTDRYICVHGHFYQPPRENPWLERIDLQDSARPYHDWNERIDRECYGPNATARILDERDRITNIVCNYDSISFNFGPTLLSWLATHDPAVYAAILAADRRSALRFGGHGSAIAQAWGHAILPLCNERDKRTQVLWGVRDFEYRFGRRPEGMWLPETAVDTATLEVLADCGVRFTILAPSQAVAVRPRGTTPWLDVADGAVDTRRPYRCPLPSGGEIALFFYDGAVSQAVAFERLLARGERFAERLLGAFGRDDGNAQLVNIATDGETYGHHHEFGDMALAWALDAIERRDDVLLTNYGEFLERHPPEQDVRIRERSAWSCAHGVGRWSEDCGCSAGAHHDWNQAWRAPLRRALDVLRDAAADLFEREAETLLTDPWQARDEYIDVLLDDSGPARQRFLEHAVARDLDVSQQQRVWKLLELQRQALLMYTSCGWFFDDLAGIETVQVLRYAARALELGEELSAGTALRERFLDALAEARSNHAGDGRRVFETLALSAAASLPRIAASLAARLLFSDESHDDWFPAVDIEMRDRDARVSGTRRLMVARIRLTRRATGDSADLTVAALYSGDHELIVGVRPFADEPTWRATAAELQNIFENESGDPAERVEALRAQFPNGTWSLAGLLADEQRFALGRILEGTLGELDVVYRKLLERHAPLRRMVAGVSSAQPLELRLPAELVLNNDVRRVLDDPAPDAAELRRLVARAAEEGLSLDGASLGLAASEALSREVGRLTTTPADNGRLERVAAFASAVVHLPFAVDLHDSQNAVWQLRERVLPERRRRSEAGDPAAREWLHAVAALAETLGVRLD